jgi:hypothetical protein
VKEWSTEKSELKKSKEKYINLLISIIQWKKTRNTVRNIYKTYLINILNSLDNLDSQKDISEDIKPLSQPNPPNPTQPNPTKQPNPIQPNNPTQPNPIVTGQRRVSVSWLTLPMVTRIRIISDRQLWVNQNEDEKRGMSFHYLVPN